MSAKIGTGDFSIGSDLWPGIGKLSEECGEVGQVVGKLIGTAGAEDHWDGTNLKDRLEEEIGDVLAASDFVIFHNDLDKTRIEVRRGEKLALFERWHVEAGGKGENPPTRQQVWERVHDIIAAQLKLTAEIDPRADLIADLKADSLDMVEMTMAMEEAFNIELSDHDAEGLTTGVKIVNFLMRDNAPA